MGDDSDSCSKVTVPLTVESPRSTATRLTSHVSYDTHSHAFQRQGSMDEFIGTAGMGAARSHDDSSVRKPRDNAVFGSKLLNAVPVRA